MIAGCGLWLGPVACADRPEVCEPNLTRECLCAGRAKGAQSCDPGGDKWAPCDCAPNGPTPDAGGADAREPRDAYESNEDIRDGRQDATEDASGGEVLPLEQGAPLYKTYCSACHGSAGTGTGAGPDIIRDVFREDVRDLVEVMLEGEDRMPPIGITEPQAVVIAQWMKSTFPPPPPEEEEEEED